ncbi:unnamed protein product [marine sediment metagenome]|uniref:Uncharacterized protein n=1 Tax=marine sediment metagenome TaxID=412755 RepID=X1KLM2_9ZZZZ
MKKGIRKILIILSILPEKNRKNVLLYLSVFEKKYIINFVNRKGGWNFIKFSHNLKSLKIVNKLLNKHINKSKHNFWFEIIYIN